MPEQEDPRKKPPDYDDLPPGERAGFADQGRRYTDDQANGQARPHTRKLYRESEWRKRAKAPHWLVYNIFERGYVYSLTGRYGTGKTTVALLLSYLMAAPNIKPREFGPYEVERGAVAIFAGENPTDVIRRGIGARIHHQLGNVEADVFLVEGRFSIKDEASKLIAQVPADKPLAMIIVDTAAAFFEGEEENSNSAMLAYAQTLRKLTELPGNPMVLVLCHPKLNTPKEDMVPRGGSAFTGELDGNVGLWEEGERLIEFYSCGKPLRSSSGFEPIKLELVSVYDDLFKDTKGRPFSVAAAAVVSTEEADNRKDQAVTNETLVLDALASPPARGMRHGQIMEVTKIAASTLTGVLRRLMAGGDRAKVEQTGSLYILRTNTPKKPKKTPSQYD